MAEPVAVLGIDFHRSPLTFREAMAVAETEVPDFVNELLGLSGCREAVVLSTCNRVECYFAGTVDRSNVHRYLAGRQGVSENDIEQYSYWHQSQDVARHVCRVAASLESMVVGEYQIMHQMKRAYEASQRVQATGPRLNPLFQHALAVGKRVRNETAIGQHKVSVASVAVDLVKQIHSNE